MGEFKGPIVEGAYYEREDGSVGRATWRRFDDGFDAGDAWDICGDSYDVCGHRFHPNHPTVEGQVFVTRTDPAEVVTELQRRSAEASMHSYSAGYHEAAAHEMALAQAYESAADLVTEKLVGGK